MKSMSNRLMFGTALSQPMWAPPGGGGGGGGGDQIEEEEPDPLALGDDDYNFDDPPSLEGDNEDELGDEDELNVGKPGFLAQLFTPKDGEEQDDGEIDWDAEAGDSAEAQAALGEEMKNSIAAFQIPEDMIPEDFNAGDPKQLRDLLANVNKHAIQTTMAIMWKPVAAAMKQTQVRLRQEMTGMVKQGVGGNTLQTMLESAIPIASDPGYKAVVKTVVDQAKKRYTNPKDIVAATRKSLIAMGVNVTKSKPGTSNGRPTARTQKQASFAVLDQFAPLPPGARANGGGSQQSDRLRNRLVPKS